MKKNLVNLIGFYKKSNKMLIVLIFLLSFTLPLASQTDKITINQQSTSIGKIIKEIESQTKFLFVFDKKDVNLKQAVKLKTKTGNIESILNEMLQGTNITYTIKDRNIMLHKVADKSKNSATKGKVVKGTIKDTNGETLIGVAIKEKGTQNGAASDIDGNFSITLTGASSKLVFTYVGFTTLEQDVTGKSNLEITLAENVEELDEVIILGYGTTTKRSSIAAVSKVEASEMEKLPIVNMTQGLAGRSPGLIVKTNGGGINSKSQVTIRGGGQPLVVIDGIIREYDDFTSLSPEDIETMQILKDASATAVYGSRASNGILQIATKKGKAGMLSINYNFNQSWSQPMHWPKKLDSYNKAFYINEANRNDGKAEAYTPEDLQLFKDGTDPLGHPNTDWRKLTLKNWSPQAKHSIVATGGQETNNYYFSLSHLKQESLYKSNNHNMRRVNFRLSQSSLFKSIGLKITTQLDGYLQKIQHPNTSTSGGTYGVFSHIQNKSPMLIGVNNLGLPYTGSDNPVAETAKDTGYNRDRSTVINGSLGLEWALPWVDGLKLRATGNYRYYVNESKNWRKDAAQYGWDSTEPTYLSKPKLNRSTDKGYRYTLQYFADYSKKIADHSFNVLGGYEAAYGFSDNEWLSRENYDFPIDQFNPGPQSTMKNGGGESESGRAGWIGQVKYNYAYKYFVEASMRHDGSDNFPKGRRWKTFFSTSLGWSLGDEAFMSKLKEKHIIDMFKLRGSYGQVGLDNWDSDTFRMGRFEYFPSYQMDGQAYVVDGKLVPGFSEGALPSPALEWFTTDQYDFGFDFSSLNNRLYGSFSYFYYKTKGFLYSPDPLNVGYVDPLGTALPKISTNGEHRRAGVEFQLGWKDSFEDFTYDVSFNLTKFDQLWANNPSESLENKKNPYKRETQQKNNYWGIGYNSLGFYQNEYDVYNNPRRLSSSNITGGDLKYYDFNGDGVIDGADQIRIGKNSFPRANYGINLKFGYKGFYLDMLFQGATRFDMALADAYKMSNPDTGTTPVYKFQTNYWRPDNQNAKYPRLLSSNGVNGNNNMATSNFWLVNGAYFRMKDIQFGYDFKKIVLKRVPWISKLNVGISGQNLFTISDATKYGLDPENGSSSGYAYPNQRTFAININVGF